MDMDALGYVKCPHNFSKENNDYHGAPGVHDADFGLDVPGPVVPTMQLEQLEPW